MNEILHHQIVIDLDIWSAAKGYAEVEMDQLIGLLKEKKLLGHCGNVKLTVLQVGRQVV